MQESAETLSQIKAELLSVNLLPKEIEISAFGDFFFSNIQIKDHEGVISDSVVCGFDKDPELALLKSLSEYVEALSFQKGAAVGLNSCMTARSDGFAAFPKAYEGYAAKTREIAFAEAVERFVWASWWDKVDSSFMVDSVSLKSSHLLLELSKIIELESVLLVKPSFLLAGDQVVLIYLAFLKGGGVISGGACGKPGQTETRALAELIRHGLAAVKLRASSLVPSSFYEERLGFFLTSEGESLVRARLLKKGQMPIPLPKLIIDVAVPSVAPDTFYVHRCLFDGQPAFIGGDLKRFCL